MKKEFFSFLASFIFIFSCYSQENSAKPIDGYEAFTQRVNQLFKLNDSEISKDISGEIILDFRVNEKGKIDSADIVQDLGDQLALRLLKSVKNSGEWISASKNGVNVATWVRFPYKVLSNKESSILVKDKAMPEEGIEILLDKFYKNFQYPDEAIKAGISGDFVLEFVVSEEGKVKNVKLQKDPGYSILQNATRALNRSGKWKAAEQNGTKIKSTVVLPFKLTLKEFRRHI